VEGGTGTDQPNGSIFGFIIGLATQGSDPAPEFRGLQFRHQVGLTNASAGVHSNNILEIQQTSPAISGAGSNLQTSGNPPGAGSPAGTDKSEIGPAVPQKPTSTTQRFLQCENELHTKPEIYLLYALCGAGAFACAPGPQAAFACGGAILGCVSAAAAHAGCVGKARGADVPEVEAPHEYHEERGDELP
jgi:hypothetical protein